MDSIQRKDPKTMKMLSNVQVSEEYEYLKKYAINLGDLIQKRNPRAWNEIISAVKFAENAKSRDKQIGIGCFTEDPCNVLMWSHYGEKHTGACLKFRHDKTSDLWGSTFPVRYQKQRPKFTWKERDLRNQAKVILLGFLVKSEPWKYEREWRSFTFSGHGREKIDSSALVEVIFGVNTTKEDIEKVKSALANNKYKHIKLKRMKLSFREYALEVSDFY